MSKSTFNPGFALYEHKGEYIIYAKRLWATNSPYTFSAPCAYATYNVHENRDNEFVRAFYRRHYLKRSEGYAYGVSDRGKFYFYNVCKQDDTGEITHQYTVDCPFMDNFCHGPLRIRLC